LRFLITYIICSLILINGSAFSQNNDSIRLTSNFEIYENALRKTYYTLEDQINLIGKDKIFYFQLDAKDEVRDFYINTEKRYLNNYKILTEDTNKREYSLILKDIDLRTEYKKVKSNLLLGKKVKRIVNLKYDFAIKNETSGNVIFLKSFTESYEDTLSYEDVNGVEASGYSFTKGKIPEETLFEKILVPGIAVVASAAAIILFFVIRSK